MIGYAFRNIPKLLLLFLTTFLIVGWEVHAFALAEPEKGQMLVETQNPEVGKWPVRLRIALPIEAKPETVWRVLTDYDHMTEFVPHMVRCRVVERQKDTYTVEQVYRHLLVSMEILLSIKESPPDRIDFHRVGGNMKVYDGHWSIKPNNPEGSLLTLEVAVEPGFFAPRGIVSWILKRELPEGILAIGEKAVKDSEKTLPSK